MVQTRRQLSATAQKGDGEDPQLDQRNETMGYTKAAEVVASVPNETTTRTDAQNKLTICNHNTTEDASTNYDELFQWLSHDSLDFHCFREDTDVHRLQQRLLTWYNSHRRRLPWRGDPSPWGGSTSTTTKMMYPHSAYGTWVSEIMLQQTRVEAVVPKWCAWMDSFPTVRALAEATPEQVNARWAGLGFYARGRRLHQAAQQVVAKQKEADQESGDDTNNINVDSVLPTTVEGWMQLPGVGRYTASAICTIAYSGNNTSHTPPPALVPAVDGNVCRVLSRLCGVATTVKTPVYKDRHAWTIADTLIVQNNDSIGSFNQAMMELGATHCAPHGKGDHPDDPWRGLYLSNRLQAQVTAYKRSREGTMEDLLQKIPLPSASSSSCPVCSNVAESLERMWNAAPTCTGHAGFPLPPAPPKQRQETYAVAVIGKGRVNSDDASYQEANQSWWLCQRPSKGLLAGQWEFPCVRVEDANKTLSRKQAIDQLIPLFPDVQWEVQKDGRLDTPIEHVFSHVVHTMHVARGTVADEDDLPSPAPGQWMTEADFQQVGVTSGVRKILAAVTITAKTATTAKKKPSIKGRKRKAKS